MIKQEHLAKEFGFIDFYEIKGWSESMEPDYKFSEHSELCLYTDGDSGLAVISISEVFDDAGLDIELVDCMYCGFNYFELGDIFDALVDAFNNWSEE